MPSHSITKRDIIGILVIMVVIWFIAIPFVRRLEEKSGRVRYVTNLKIIYTLIRQYAEQNVKYPTPENWCDEIVNSTGLREDFLFSDAAGDPLYYFTEEPNKTPTYPGGMVFLRKDTDVNGLARYSYCIRWSHFAINANVEPNSPGDVVLLFSTKGGWNQFGGEEIFGAENYKEIGLTGGYVLFNNGDVKFVKPNEVAKLNWNGNQ